MRIEKNPEKIYIINIWDETLYNQYTCSKWLVNLLVKNHIIQSNFVNTPLGFDSPEFISLLERAKAIELALYSVEPVPGNGYPGLIQSISSGG